MHKSKDGTDGAGDRGVELATSSLGLEILDGYELQPAHASTERAATGAGPHEVAQQRAILLETLTRVRRLQKIAAHTGQDDRTSLNSLPSPVPLRQAVHTDDFTMNHGEAADEKA